MASSLPTNSSARLVALRRSGLLDRPSQEQFGHLTEHLRLVLNAPVAIISLVDEHRQVFAGHSGLPEPWASMGETPISHSFCQHVVDRGEALAIADALAEPLVRNNLAIPDLGVVAYLGVPIHLPTGELAGALAAIDSHPRHWSDHDLRILYSAAQIVEKEIRVGVSEAKYRMLIQDMQEGFYVGHGVRDAGGRLTDIRFDEINPAFERLTGLSSAAVIGKTLSQLSVVSRDELLPAFTRVLDTGELTTHVSESTVLPGRWFENWLSRLDGDRVVGFFNDVTARRDVEEHQAVLQLELSHRLKNMFMMVQALAIQTLKPVTERGPVEALQRRIQALGSAHDILLAKQWQGSPVGEVARAALSRLSLEDRIDMGGPEIDLGPKATLSLSLLLHELATNAIKYGALSNTHGRVRITWSVEGALMHLAWVESGGPLVLPPERTGFGSKLIQMGLGAGTVRTTFAVEGFALALSAPLDYLRTAA